MVIKSKIIELIKIHFPDLDLKPCQIDIGENKLIKIEQEQRGNTIKILSGFIENKYFKKIETKYLFYHNQGGRDDHLSC